MSFPLTKGKNKKAQYLMSRIFWDNLKYYARDIRPHHKWINIEQQQQNLNSGSDGGKD